MVPVHEPGEKPYKSARCCTGDEAVHSERRLDAHVACFTQGYKREWHPHVIERSTVFISVQY